RGVGNNSTNSLHIRASERGDTSANRLRVRLTSSLTNGQIATLRADVRWLRGNPEILLRLHGNYLEAPGVMPVPKNLGTPGQPNSRLIADSGPTITAVQHTPILPVANQAVTVIARVDDPDRVALVAVNYRVDPNTNYTRVPMTYSGAGYYSGVIPGQTNLATVPFYIETLDARGATARFPSDAPNREGVILFGDGSGRGSFATYHLWLSRTNINRWTTREQSSNEPLDATFVYNNERIIYNMGALYSGSPFHWRGYNGPLGNSANYLITFPDDDLFLGQNSSVLNLPSNLASDNTGVREQTFFWMAEQVSQPHNHRRYNYLFLNGLDRDGTSIFEDAQQPNGDMIKEWFPNDTGGDLYKIEDWFEYSDTFNFFNMDSELVGVWTTNLVTGARELKQERYRWWFRKRAVHDSAHDYSELLRLVLAVNNTNVDQFVGETQSLVDIDEWMGAIAIRHMAGDWDSYGYSRGKNMYAYKPPGGKWNLMHWDIAFAFGLGDPAVPLDPTSSGGLFDVSHFGGSIDPIDTITKKMMDTPVFRRAYFRAFYDLVNGPMQSARVNSVIDTKFDSLLANGINASAPDTVKNWIAQRRDYILAQLGSVSASFSITNNGGNNFTTNRNTVMLAGTAPVNVKSIRVNGAEYPVTWTSATTWQIPLALKPQLNLIRIEGYDSSGQLIADAADTITINVTNAGEPLAGNVVINEIQYHPAVSGTEFIEIFNKARITSFDLSGYRLNGAGFDFPPGSVITPGGFLVIAKDAAAFGEQYGFNIPVVGEFSGTLQNGGEALTLVGPGAGGTNVVLSGVRYDNALPWPSAADGSGGSLQLIDPSQDPSRVANWAIDGTRATPGATNSVRGTLAAFPAVWVNEVQAVNLNGPADSAGNRDPWLELYNSGSSAVSLAGYYLTDDTTNLTKWPFPTGASIAPGQRLIIWLDGQPAQSTSTEWHTSFRLAAASGSIALVGTQRNAPAVFDYLKFDQVPDGQSYGAFPEGQAVTRATFSKPTPGASNDNSPPAVHVLINEWMASNTHTIQDPDDLAFNDWFELYNAGSDPADLSGYTLTDDLTKPAQSSLPQATVIPPHGFLFVWADGDHSTNGQVHVSFKLSASGDTIALLAPDGSTVDLVTFGSQAADVSEGRSPDGSSNIATQAVATPGAPNGGLDPNALQFRSVSIAQGSVTLTWNGVAGSTYAVLYKNSLTDASWTQLRTVAATGSTTSTTDTVSGASRFYRIQKL
ncbi:MAG TPA: lamin tail domain-containing protein, partial [Verrucomicrobiae bacterium]|nr:lamin tail domain-containing protein [Verrucomicrobiae bacterium]